MHVPAVSSDHTPCKWGPLLTDSWKLGHLPGGPTATRAGRLKLYLWLQKKSTPRRLYGRLAFHILYSLTPNSHNPGGFYNLYSVLGLKVQEPCIRGSPGSGRKMFHGKIGRCRSRLIWYNRCLRWTWCFPVSNLSWWPHFGVDGRARPIFTVCVLQLAVRVIFLNISIASRDHLLHKNPGPSIDGRGFRKRCDILLYCNGLGVPRRL